MSKPPRKIRTVPHGEVQKQFIVIGVTIISVVLLLTFIFTQGNFAGQAFTTGGNTLDWEFLDQDTLQLTFNPAQEINSVYIEFTAENLCDNYVEFIPLIAWGFAEAECSNNILTFMDASIDPSTFQSTKFEVANFIFQGLPENFELTMTDAAAYETASGTDVFLAGPDLEVVELDVPARQPVPQRGTGGCTASWKCGSWGLCNSTLQEGRTCQDNACNNPARNEVRACPVCEVNWQCDSWSACSGGQQRRSCTDLSACGTSNLQPADQRACATTPPSGLARPAQPSAPSPALSQPIIQQAEETFIQKYLVEIIISAAAFLLVIQLLLYLFLSKPKRRLTYNYNALRTWMKQERAMGTSDKDIKNILRDQTGWTKKEVTMMFSELPKQ